MAFVRFGTDSGLYIYEESGDWKVCSGCSFAPSGTDYFRTKDLDQMLDHVRRHRAAGDIVPDWLEKILRDEWIDEP